MGVGAAAGVEIVDLMLREEAGLQFRCAHHLAGHQRQPAAHQLGEGRLAVAVGADQADAVVGLQAEVERDSTARPS